MPAWLSTQKNKPISGEAAWKTCKTGDIILLFGDLGSGKTVFSRGIAHGAGVSVLLPVHIYYNECICWKAAGLSF